MKTSNNNKIARLPTTSSNELFSLKKEHKKHADKYTDLVSIDMGVDRS